MDQDILNKRIAVAGIGGVGGYLAGMLGRVCPHLTMAVRGDRRESILKNGLVLHSEYKGEINVRPEYAVPVSEMGEQDYIFVCVKNYSLEDVCREMEHAVTENTVIIPVMNGVDPGERIRKALGKGTVVDSLIYIVAFANKDYSVTQQGDFANLRIGIRNADETQQQKVQEVSDILTGADIDHMIAEDIEVEIWRKYILNCAYNTESAYYDNAIGQLRSDPKKAEEYEALVREAYQVAQAKGVGVRQEHVDAILHRFYHELAENATSSLQRDIRAGKKAEVETFSGYIVREGQRLGIRTPVTEKMYEGLKALQH
ncbi:MAG TPA: 2-dehydropantoate 2-reductase [Candidatus Mediterraneibacter stercoravium]|uniref:2-dehydropantoate 2-reductase n=1 Tax=Candidatus Mediterraneibacter stercoravium TaxID=2838685 RepID=A0A9D2G7P5_9FIRM|nr:2-dehydropantoate 2-reductase [Candidatus Mediterraneibacter stercoravium]